MHFQFSGVGFRSSPVLRVIGAFVAVIGIQPPPLGADEGELRLASPRDFQVVQRSASGKGTMRVTGRLSEDAPADSLVEVRFVGADASWMKTDMKVTGRSLSAQVEAPAGGWWKLEVRVSHAGKVLASGGVEHVGVGEVFVVAGQSNSANFGEEKQTTQTGRVAAFDGEKWQPANDPQPGAGGRGGSFMPPLGDALAKRFDVPIGFIACGIGATSVREWLPKGEAFPNPPTLTGRVERRADGQWASNGAAFETFVSRLKAPGSGGFRAVLWHQGESDANQARTECTLPGQLYRQYLEILIRESRRAIGWEAPWFVAQASYHVPGDEGSNDIRAAQASLWRDGIALEGPDSDALKGSLREGNGRGVHFSGPGLREHADRWMEKIVPWIESRQFATGSAALPGEAGPAKQ